MKKSQKTVNFCYIMSQTYGINYTTRWNLVNLNYQINKVIIKITKSMYLSQDARDGLQPNHYHCVEIHWSGTQFGYIIHEIGNRVRGCRWTWTPLSGTQQPDLSGLMLWITSFNCCRTSLLLLLLNVFLKIRAVYLKADSTISGAFQCSSVLSRCTIHLHLLHY